MENQNNNKGVIVLLIILVIILSVLCVLFATNTISFNSKELNNNLSNESNKEGNKNESNINDNISNKNSSFGMNDTFSNVTESGQVDVLGYVTILKREEPSYSDNAGKVFDYIFFNILETKSNDFLDFINNWKGNSFVSEKAIGLGCNINSLVEYYNSSNQNGMQKYVLSAEDSNEILSSSKNNPIKIRLNRLELFGGAGAPVCYSHITNIEIIKD